MRSFHDLPLKVKLLVGMVTVSLFGGLLTLFGGSYLLNEMVMSEAERRVQIALKTADGVLIEHGERVKLVCSVVADGIASQGAPVSKGADQRRLEVLREKGGFDYLHVVDASGRVVTTARGNAQNSDALSSAVVSAALETGAATVGYRLVSALDLSAESPELASRAFLRVTETPRAREGGPTEVREGVVLEAASPIIRPPGDIIGAVRAGVLLNRNFALVDLIRDRIFTAATYGRKNLGTVTIFLGDVRVATNVVDDRGERAVGTRVSREVYERVIGRGLTWIGPAFVLDSWYVSAYEPLKDPQGRTIGMLYAGVIKDRYDDMLRNAMGVFLSIALVVMLAAVVASVFVASRLSRPLTLLAEAAVRAAEGDFEHGIPASRQGQRYEISLLNHAFRDMLDALRERDARLRASVEELQATSEELRRWNQNYLDTLEFITHELKNQVAALKINVLALHGGYVGDLTEEQREALDDVHSSIVRTEEMILNYLNLSRIEKGELEVRARPVAVLHDVVKPVLRDLRGRFEEKRMSIQVELGEELCVQADPSLLQIVYENLLGNAAKYGEPGGTVTVLGAQRNGMVELHVRNDGQGADPEQFEEMFRKFARIHRVGEMERGSGLGLYITREIVHKHGGRITVESQPGEWIDFVFTLPRPDVVPGAEEDRFAPIGDDCGE